VVKSYSWVKRATVRESRYSELLADLIELGYEIDFIKILEKFNPFVKRQLEPPQFGALPPGKPLLGGTLQHHILNAVLFAKSALLRFVAVLIDCVDIRLDVIDLGLGVHPAMP
jgi:hypothetical protein